MTQVITIEAIKTENNNKPYMQVIRVLTMTTTALTKAAAIASNSNEDTISKQQELS